MKNIRIDDEFRIELTKLCGTIQQTIGIRTSARTLITLLYDFTMEHEQIFLEYCKNIGAKTKKSKKGMKINSNIANLNPNHEQRLNSMRQRGLPTVREVYGKK